MGHGINDALKTMDIIAVLLFSSGYLSEFHVPFWVILLSHAAIALGTLTGGWRVVRTMGMRITKLRPVHGFCAESTAVGVLAGTAFAGIPVSTINVIAGSIMGVGATKRFSAVRWGVTRNIVWAWILAIPLSALAAGGVYIVISTIL